MVRSSTSSIYKYESVDDILLFAGELHGVAGYDTFAVMVDMLEHDVDLL